jgi:hypothetical protein
MACHSEAAASQMSPEVDSLKVSPEQLELNLENTGFSD